MTHLAEIRVPEPQNNSKNNTTNITRGHMGQIPVIRCFVQKFYLFYFLLKVLSLLLQNLIPNQSYTCLAAAQGKVADLRIFDT